MQSDQVQALRSDLPTANAYTLKFDPSLLGEIQLSYRQDLTAYLSRRPHLFAGGKCWRQRLEAYDLFSYNDYPLLWLSANQSRIFAIYQRFFENLNLAESLKHLIIHHHRIQLFCGFLVIGNQAPTPLWHQDYQVGAAAFTLLTPLFELDPKHGHLLYMHDQQVQKYRYKMGESLILGSGFEHSTEPYSPTSIYRVLVSLTFGSDLLDQWPQIEQNVKQQSRYYYLPCGHLKGHCMCLPKQRLRYIFKGQAPKSSS